MALHSLNCSPCRLAQGVSLHDLGFRGGTLDQLEYLFAWELTVRSLLLSESEKAHCAAA